MVYGRWANLEKSSEMVEQVNDLASELWFSDQTYLDGVDSVLENTDTAIRSNDIHRL